MSKAVGPRNGLEAQVQTLQREVQSRDSKVKALEDEAKDLRQKPKTSTTVASSWEDVWFVCKFAVRGGGGRFGRRGDYADSVATSWLALLLTSPRLLEESMTGTACEMMIAHAIVGELIGAGVLPIHLVVAHVDMVVVVAGVPSCVLLITQEMTQEITQEITQEVKLRLWRGGRTASKYRRGFQIPRMGFSFWLGGGEGAPRPKGVMKYGQRSWRRGGWICGRWCGGDAVATMSTAAGWLCSWGASVSSELGVVAGSESWGEETYKRAKRGTKKAAILRPVPCTSQLPGQQELRPKEFR